MIRIASPICAAILKATLTVFVFLVLLSQVGCDEKALVCIGKEEEIQIGDHFTPGMLRQFGGEADDVETQKLITRVGKTIADKSDRKEMPWEFYYTNSDIPNSFALPGHVFVTRGLIEQLKGPDGEVDVDMLAGVLGHEISHVVARHTARLVAERRFADLVEAGLDLLTKRDVTADESAQFLRQFLQLGYTRNLEEEADRLGAIYTARAGYSRDGLLRAGERLLRLEGRYSDATPWYSRTHPEWRQRVRALEEQLPTLDDATVNVVAYKVNDRCSGWWGLVNLGVQYVRARFMLKSGAEISLVDSTGLGHPDTVVRSDGQQKTFYGIAKGEKGLWQVATRVGPTGKPNYTGVVGYAPEKARELKQKAARLLAQGQTKLAINELKRAIELGAGDAETRLQLARAYEKVGDVVSAKAVYRSILREEWEGQQAEQSTAALNSTDAVSGDVRPRQVNQPALAVKPRRAAPSSPPAGRAVTLDVLEEEVWKKLNIPANEFDSWTQTWGNAQAILQEMRRQVAAGRAVTVTVIKPEVKVVRVTDPSKLILNESYEMKGEFQYDIQEVKDSGTIQGRCALSIIDATHLELENCAIGENEQGLVTLTKTGPSTFTAHFSNLEKPLYTSMCGARSLDIMVHLGDGEIRAQVAITECADGGSAKMDYRGTFSFATVVYRP